MKNNGDIPEGEKIVKLGELPEGWRIISIQEIFHESSLKFSKIKNPPHDIPILSMTRYEGLVLQSEKFGKRVASKNLSNYKVVREGEFVVGFPIDEGVIYALKNFPCGVVSPVYTIWKKINDSVDSDFLDYYLKTPEMIEKYKQVMVHAVERRRYIKKEDFLALTLPLPPLPEQHAIAATLRTVQEAKEKTDAVIAATKALKAAMMKHLFTYGPVPPEEAEWVALRETVIGQIPVQWEVVKLGEISEFLQYGTSKKCDYNVTGYPVLRIPNIVNGIIDSNDLKFLDTTPDDFKKIQLCIGDILFVRTNGVRNLVGRSAIYQGEPGNCLFASYLIRVRLKAGQATPAFIQYYSETPPGREFLSGQASGSADGKFNINTQTIRDVVLPLPEIAIQKKIVDIITSIDQKLAAEQSRREALDTLFESLLHDLMTAKIRVSTA